MGSLVAALTYVLRIKIPQTCKKIPFLDQFSMKIYLIWRGKKGGEKSMIKKDERGICSHCVPHRTPGT